MYFEHLLEHLLETVETIETVETVETDDSMCTFDRVVAQSRYRTIALSRCCVIAFALSHDRVIALLCNRVRVVTFSLYRGLDDAVSRLVRYRVYRRCSIASIDGFSIRRAHSTHQTR